MFFLPRLLFSLKFTPDKNWNVYRVVLWKHQMKWTVTRVIFTNTTNTARPLISVFSFSPLPETDIFCRFFFFFATGNLLCILN